MLGKKCFAGHVQSRTNHVRSVPKGEIHFASLIFGTIEMVIGRDQVSRLSLKTYSPPQKKTNNKKT